MNLAEQNHYQVELATLRRRCDEIEEENRQLKEKRVSATPIVRVTLGGIHLTPMEENILYCLSRQEFTSKDMLWDFLYGNRPLDEQPFPKIIDIAMVKIRQKLKPLDLEIQTIWGRGFSMSEAHRAIIAAHSERYDGGAQ